MATVFIHHAPSDDVLAANLAQALRAEGFDGAYLHRNDGRPSWLEALTQGRETCRAVIDLVTEAWLADATLLEETHQAQRLGKPTLSLLAIDEDSKLGADARERLVQLRRSSPAVPKPRRDSPLLAPKLLAMLRGLGAHGGFGPDPFVFPIGADMPPYRGARPFGDEDSDAALFFGRGREIVECLELMRAQRARHEARPVVFLGPARSGKSSLVLAGLLPRLRREAPTWTVLRPLRADSDPLLALASAITSTLADFDAHVDARDLRQQLVDDWIAGSRAVSSRLNTLSSKLREEAERPYSTLVLAVEPCASLFEGDSKSAQATRKFLSQAASDDSPWSLLFTARESEFRALLQHEELRELPWRPHELRPLPAFRFDEVITGPARRMGKPMDVDLVHALICEVPKRGELALLAHVLERLHQAGLGSGLQLGAEKLAEKLVKDAPADLLTKDAPEGARTRTTSSSPSRQSASIWALGSSALGLTVFLSWGLLEGGWERQALARWWRQWTVEVPYRIREVDPFLLSREQERSLEPGDMFRECAQYCPEMVVVPAGSFLMGDEDERDATLLPRHRVHLSRDFAVGRTEVSFAQYGACIRFGSCNDWPEDYQIHEDNGSKPVVHLRAEAMRAYIAWIRKATGRNYRLLSSAEWEYVARAGSAAAFSWGEEMIPNRAHCARGCGSPFREDRSLDRDFLVATAPVASFVANPFGVFDMHGNVWELVEDCWHETYQGAPNDGSPWGEANGGDCSGAVVRGGGWQSVPRGIRSSARDWLPADTTARPTVGFRVARDLED
ncbi:MAG: SUMF1/EgtB/PvdO family nonheme iron enzyme [Myxococcota bacterium]